MSGPDPGRPAAEEEAGVEVATLGGGCFWCLEAVFERVDGVLSVKSGYAGGHDPGPTYERVCSGATGHAEVVRVRFDPVRVSYRDLLEIFFVVHDPTTKDRQGHDVGSQYRSVILHHDEAQRVAARATIEALDRDGPWDDPIVTEVVPFERFHPAEPYHDGYFRGNPRQAYCRAVIEPKVARFRTRFAHRMRG